MIELERRANEILDQALDLDEGERPAFLQRSCGESTELRLLVGELLRGCEAIAEDWSAGMASELSTLRQSIKASIPPQRLGAYVLQRELGRGGMGVVHLAARNDGALDQLVAIKLVYADAPLALRQRFRQERQLLSSLNHPGIARLLDAGESEAGQPYLVMELVDGKAIDDYCRQHRSPIRERLALLLAVCDAVAYAHGLLVVHRDLKPSNILVTADGQPKLLDFGIAQLLHGTADAGDPDRLNRRLLTPEWATPEQLRGDPATVHSDIYQLGLLMHLLLAGGRPYQLDAHSPAERLALVCEQPRTAPAEYFRSLPADEQAAHAAAMSASSQSVARALSGDLGLILHRALCAQPRQSYPSVAALREDLRRYLAGYPVAARPATVSYRLVRFLQRNRVAAGSVALTGLAALVAVAITWSDLRRQRDQAELLARAANQAALESAATADFLATVLRKIDPRYGAGSPDISLREAIEQSAADMDSQLQDQPQVLAKVQLILANAFNSLGEFERAQRLATSALTVFEAAQTADALESAQAWQAVGASYDRMGQLDKADAALRRALAALAKVDQPHPTQRAWLLSDLGTITDRNGGDGMPLFQEAEAILLEAQSEAYPGQLGSVYGNMAIHYKNKGRRGDAGAYDRSLELHRRSIAEFNARPELQPKLPRTHLNLAILLVEMGRLAEALELFERARVGTAQWLGPNHPQMARVLSNYGRAALLSGQTAQAGALLEEALRIRLQLHGSEHPDVAIAQFRLGEQREAEGRWNEAATLFRQALATRRIVHPPTHSTIAETEAAMERMEARLRGSP